MEGIGERGEAGELEEDEIWVSEGLLLEIMVVMMIVEPEDLQDAPLLTVMYGGVVVEEADNKTVPLSEVVVTSVPGDPQLTALMTDPVIGAKARLAVESVEPSLEMRDQESGQLVNKTTAGPRSSVNPLPTIKFLGRICENLLVNFLHSQSGNKFCPQPPAGVISDNDPLLEQDSDWLLK